MSNQNKTAENAENNELVNNGNIGFLFDLDGVLIDSESQYTNIWSDIDRAFPTGVENFALKIKGTTLENILSTYFPGDQLKKDVKKMLDEKEAEMEYEYTPGAEALLSALKENGQGAVIVTSSNDEKMSILWKQHPEMKAYFNSIVDGDQVSRSKPDPEGYLLGADRLGADAKRCVVFEDSMQGVKAGRAAGSYVVGVAGTNSADKLAEYADIVVDSLEEISWEKLAEILRSR